MIRRALLTAVGTGMVWLASTTPVLAQANNARIDIDGIGAISAPLQVVLLLTLLSFIPAILMTMTAFTRIVIVFHFLRQALGTQEAPSNQILIGLSLFLTVFVMAPTAEQINQLAVQPVMRNEITVTQGDRKVTVTAGSCTIEAGTAIELKVGGNSIKIEQAGITIKATQVSIQGEAKTEVKGAVTQVNGDGMLQMKGGTVAKVSITLTNAGPTPLKCCKAEDYLVGKPLDAATLNEAVRLATAPCAPGVCLRGDAD